MLIQTVPEGEASGLAAELYEADIKAKGYVSNPVKALSLRPEVYKAWMALLGAIRTNMRLRRYELVTLAAAQAMGCKY